MDDKELRCLESVSFLLARTWFRCDLPEGVETEIECSGWHTALKAYRRSKGMARTRLFCGPSPRILLHHFGENDPAIYCNRVAGTEADGEIR